MRQVRAALAEHFDVEDSRLKEEKSQFIKTACQDAVSKIEAAAAKPDSSEVRRPVLRQSTRREGVADLLCSP